jgi:Zn-dependent protease
LQGRLTLNPLPHIDPLGAVAFLLAGFGWAKPVPVNSYNLRHPARDMVWIAAAGPLANFAVAFVGLVAVILAQRTVTLPFVAEPLIGMLAAVYRFNLVLAIFNLIPLPPLDGGHFLPYFLPRRSWTLMHRLEQYGPLLLLLLVMSGATRYIVGPVFGVVSSLYLALVRFVV